MSGEDRRDEAARNEAEAARTSPEAPDGVETRPDLEREAELAAQRDADRDAAADAAERAAAAEEAADAANDPVEQDYQEHRRSGGLAPKLLIGLLLLLAGAAIAIWALPRVAPSLPAPIAAYVSPLGATAGEVAQRLEALEARVQTLAEEDGGPSDETLARLSSLEESVSAINARLDETQALIADAGGAEELEARLRETEATLAEIRQQLSEAEGGGAAAEALTQDLEQLRAQMAELREAGVAAGPQEEVEALRERVAALDQRLQEGAQSTVEGEEVAALRERIAALDERLGERGAAANVDVEALREQVAALQTQLEESRATGAAADSQAAALLERLDALEAAQAQDQELRDQALNEARGARRAAAVGSALSQIDRAMTLGRPFGDALAGLTDLVESDPPAAVRQAAAEGAPTREELKATFNPAAHQAIEAALAGESEAEGGGVVGGVLSRLQARVTGLPQQPIEGDNAPAILSRARAHLLDGDIDATLAELQALPPAAQEAMSGWMEDARLRAAADAALAEWRAELGTQL